MLRQAISRRAASIYGAVAVILPTITGCVDVPTVTTTDGIPRAPVSSLTQTQKVWIAFLQFHDRKAGEVRFKGTQFKVAEQSHGTETPSVYAPQIDSPEAVILASGDQELIKLHQHMKASEASINDSPELKRYCTAMSQQVVVDKAYSVEAVDPNPSDQPYNTSGDGSDYYSSTIRYDARMGAARAVADHQNARLQLARQKDPDARKIDATATSAKNAYEAVKARYAIPSEELIGVIHRYMQSGTKCWGQAMSNESFGASAELTTWTY